MEGNSKGPTKIKGKNSKPKAMIDPDLNSNWPEHQDLPFDNSIGVIVNREPP
jgi:hypothetical protein